MKRLKRNHILFIPVIIIAGFLISAIGKEDNTEYIKAGFSTVKITPEEPVRMSGYAGRSEPFKGVHDDLYASAIVTGKSNIKSCIITADVIGFSHDFVDETKAIIEKESGIPAENILLSAAHNHGGPRTRAYGEEPTENEKRYVEILQGKLVQIAREANNNLQEVRIGVGKGSCNMNINRRARHAEGGVWLGRNPDGVCDKEVGVIRFDNTSGKTIGLLVNWPCHATTGGQGNYMITGDWPGAAARELENTYKDAVIMISAGASGDINPVYGPNDRFDDISVIGQLLAEEVIRINKDIETFRLDDLEVVSETIEASGKKTSESRMPDVSLDPAPAVEIRLVSLRIGNILIAGISGELMNEIGLAVKEDSPFKNTFIYTHCNGNSGYLCTDEAYKEGGYEPMVARTMPGTEKLIRETFRKMNNEL